MKLNLISVLWTLAALMAAPCVLAAGAEAGRGLLGPADAALALDAAAPSGAGAIIDDEII